MKARKALFLDRDGVINVDLGYVHQREQFMFVDGVFDLCRRAKKVGYLLFVVTNQAGIARGYYTEDDFHQLTAWMCDEFRREGAGIEKVYYCPYHPEHGIGTYKRDSSCRKPHPGMILAAADEFDLQLHSSVLIGDKESDITAGVAAGVGCNVLFCPSGDPPSSYTRGRMVRTLSDAAAFLV